MRFLLCVVALGWIGVAGSSCRRPIPEENAIALIPQSTRNNFRERIARLPDSDQGELAYSEAKAVLDSISDAGIVAAVVLLCDKEIREHVEDGDRVRCPYCEHHDSARDACFARLSELGKVGNSEAIAALFHFLDNDEYQGGVLTSVMYSIYEVGEPAVPFLESYRGPRKFAVEIIMESRKKGHPPI